MMSELTRLRDEAVRLHTIYDLHKNSEDEALRRKVHVDLDRFLMEHRETAILLMAEGLTHHINSIVVELEYEEQIHIPWYKKILGGIKFGNDKDKGNKGPDDIVEAEV